MICQALDKQNLYSKPIELRTFSYDEYERQFNEVRNSTREIIVFGGRESLNFEPDSLLLTKLLAQQVRTHAYVLVPALMGPNILKLWHPGVSGIIERGESAKTWLVAALQRLQLRQQTRTSSSSRRMGSSAEQSGGFFSQAKAAFFSFFV